MRQATKGLLLSGLVFPGLGQLLLGRRLRGGLFIAVVLASTIACVVAGTRVALGILARLEASGRPIDLAAITAAATEAAGGGGVLLIEALLGLIVLCWLVALVDAYLLGRALDWRGVQDRAGGEAQ